MYSVKLLPRNVIMISDYHALVAAVASGGVSGIGSEGAAQADLAVLDAHACFEHGQVCAGIS